jgi:hypothetical protein
MSFVEDAGPEERGLVWVLGIRISPATEEEQDEAAAEDEEAEVVVETEPATIDEVGVWDCGGCGFCCCCSSAAC